MKKQVNTYQFGKISSHMARNFGVIEKYLEGDYANILLPIESNLIRVNRKSGINNGRYAIEAIHICLFIIDGYINQIEYDLDPFISSKNEPYLSVLLMTFDPFTNEVIRHTAESDCDISSKEGLHNFFEAPVKCLLRIKKSIELWTKEYGNAGYFEFMERQIGTAITDNDKIECVVVKVKEADALDAAKLTMQGIFPDMGLREIFLELFPTITTIFQLGFIPSPDEIYELTQEQYASYQRQGGDISKPLYSLIPKNYKYLGPTNEISLMTKEDTFKLGKAAIFLYIYAEENGCESKKSEDILKFVAKKLPSAFTKDTPFESPPLRVLDTGETPLTDREEFVDLLAHVMGEGMKVDLKVTYKDADDNVEKIENISIPLEKQR